MLMRVLFIRVLNAVIKLSIMIIEIAIIVVHLFLAVKLDLLVRIGEILVIETALNHVVLIVVVFSEGTCQVMYFEHLLLV